MKPTIQQALASLEVAPPQGSWESLASRLEAEYDRSEIQLAQRMDTAVIAPPSNAWAAIAAAIPFSPEQANETITAPQIISPSPSKAPVRRLPLRRIAIAASILGIVAWSGWYLLRTTGNELPPVQANGAQANKKEDHQTSSSTTTLNIPPAIAQELPSRNNRPLAVNSLPAFETEQHNNQNSNAAAEQPESPPSDPPPATPSIVQAQAERLPGNISSRPYRDKAGKMVMDMNLLTSPGTNYVTVTGPNGEQTRISRKFLPVLTFLNTGADNGQFNALLKQRFQQWRDQLLKQPSFVPSATNFLDIMELKEFLQDK